MDKRVGATALLAIGVVVTVAGCSSGSQRTTTSPVATSTVTATATATTSPDTPASGVTRTHTPVTPAGVRPCRAADLSVHVSTDPGGGAAGSEHATLTMTNTGSAVCTVTGYPGVSFVGDGNGTQIGAAARRDGSKAVTVSIEPRGVAAAPLTIAQAGDFPGCDPVRADGLRIYPPNDVDADFVRTSSFTGCRSTSAQVLTIGTLQ